MNEILITLIILISLVCYSFLVGLSCFYWGRYYERKTEHWIKREIEELENVKNKINIKRDNLLNSDDLNLYKKCKIQGYSDSIGILNKYISDLKGEQK